MKAVRILLALAVVAMTIGFVATPAYAAGKYSSYESSIDIQNLDNATANISLIFYKQDGSIETTVPDTLAANGKKTYFPLPAGVTAGFNGSVVVTSTTNVASISNVRGLSANGASYGSYVAQNSGGTTIALPVLMKNNGKALISTWFNVQNAGTGPANVSIAYSDNTTASVSNLQPGAAKTFFQSDETHSLLAFAGTVTSNQPVVVTVVQETTQMILAANGFKAGATNPVMPLINIQPSRGLGTGVNMQNLGGTATTVTVTFTRSSDGTTCTETQTLQPGALNVFALIAFSTTPNPSGITSNCPKGGSFVGSARVTTNSAGHPLAAVVNQQKYTQAAGAYASFDPATATSKLVVPLAMDRNGKYDLGTSINLMNVGTVATTVTCTFTGTSYTYTTPSLAQGQGDSKLQGGAIADPYVGGATCTANNASAKIIAVINFTGSNTLVDQMGVFEAINVTP